MTTEAPVGLTRDAQPACTSPRTDALDEGAQRTVAGRVWFAQMLRGVACLCVVLFHLAVRYSSDPLGTDHAAALPIARGIAHPFWLSAIAWLYAHNFDLGQFGVSLFFLISGFVIPFSLRSGTLAAFGSRRILRIYPVYWFALLCTLGVLLLQSHAAATTLPFHSSAIPFNAFIVQLYAGRPSIDSVSWTLAIEDLFYVIVAVVALAGLLARPRAIAALACVLGAVTVAVGSHEPHTSAQWIAHGLAFNATGVEFILLGVCWHHAFTREWSTRTSVLVALWIGLLWLLCLHAGPLAGSEGLMRVSGAAALVVFAAAYHWRDALPSSRAVNGLANISYPLYLLHAIIGYVLLSSLVAWTGSFYLSLAVTLVAVLALAAVVHKLLEAPSITLGRRIGHRLDERRRSDARRDRTCVHPGAPEPRAIAR